MNKKIIVIIISIIIIFGLSFYSIKKLKIKNIVSKSTYIGQEYRYTYDNKNKHHDRRYYNFYIDSQNNEIYCIENNDKITKINNIKELELLYIMKVNAIIQDKANANVAYDENNNESSSYYLKNKMFPEEESNYWGFKERE